MLLLYNLGVRFYFFSVFIASGFSSKAKAWINGRKNITYPHFKKSAWFHFASLGEYEQGLPVLISYKSANPDLQTIITFFSPSGFEIRKNTPHADAVYYLPLDTPRNARRFIAAINPSVAIFTKYEYWYHFFVELHNNKVPLYIISGVFRPDQVFFQWYGGLHRKMLKLVTHFFVQDEDSIQLLHELGINHVSVSGDTRFDRVWVNSQHPKAFSLVEEFKQRHNLFIAGSTWPEDEELLAGLINGLHNWKFIIAPHEIGEERITKLMALLQLNSSFRYSRVSEEQPEVSKFNVLIVDTIGMLSSLYQYGDIAYIGGGFGAGIHNTLEAAAFGLPVIFGPNYHKFKEAKDLIDMGIGFTINTESDLKKAVEYFIEDETHYLSINKRAKEYVEANTGATETIMRYIQTQH